MCGLTILLPCLGLWSAKQEIKIPGSSWLSMSAYCTWLQLNIEMLASSEPSMGMLPQWKHLSSLAVSPELRNVTCSFMNKCLGFPVWVTSVMPLPIISGSSFLRLAFKAILIPRDEWDLSIPASHKFCSLAPPSHGIDRGFYKVAHTRRTSGQDAISRPLIDNWQRSVLSNCFFTWTFENGIFVIKSGWCEGGCKQKHTRHQQTRYVCVNRAKAYKGNTGNRTIFGYMAW